MKSWSGPFNIILFLLGLLLAGGCQSTGDKGKKKKGKEASTIEFHLETNAEDSTRAQAINIYHDPPILLYVDREAMLDTGDVEWASVTPSYGTFVLKIQFNRHGTWVLENVTAGYKGKRLAIYSTFGQARWLGAPLIRQHIANGLFTFTPDVTYEEAERIVRGLNNVAAELKKKEDKF